MLKLRGHLMHLTWIENQKKMCNKYENVFPILWIPRMKLHFTGSHWNDLIIILIFRAWNCNCLHNIGFNGISDLEIKRETTYTRTIVPLPGQVVTLAWTRTSFCSGSQQSQYARQGIVRKHMMDTCIIPSTIMSKWERIFIIYWEHRRQFSWGTGDENVGEFLELHWDGWLGPHLAREVRLESSINSI